jgi:hypothetical protein
MITFNHSCARVHFHTAVSRRPDGVDGVDSEDPQSTLDRTSERCSMDTGVRLSDTEKVGAPRLRLCSGVADVVVLSVAGRPAILRRAWLLSLCMRVMN